MSGVLAKTFVLLLALCALGFARSALADEKLTLSGSWSASALSESWSISDWGAACGPKPEPHGAGGGSVQVKQNGSELVMSGAGRTFSTTECWEQMPGLSRTSHSGGGRGWRTRCATPSNDARQAQVVTSISATDSTISIQETGQYQFVIHNQTCTASVSRARTMTLVHREGEESPVASAAPPVATATAAPKAVSKCSGPAGDPARLEVHPAKKLLKAGESFVFHAVVLDAEGCGVATHPSWRIVPGPLAEKASIAPTGELTIAEGAPEGQLELAVSIAGKGVTIPIEIASDENYDALFASRYGDGGDDEVAVAVIATGTIGGRTALAEDAAKQRKILFVAIVAGLSLCLGFVGLIVARKGKRAERPSFATDSLTPPASGTLPPESAPLSLPAPIPAEKPRVQVRQERGKICPTCGEHYPPEASFCGKDSTILVPLN